MIKLDRLVLNNVGPYRVFKDQKIKTEIKDNADKDYIFLHGSPTHGKTSFRNALSWLLCHKFSDDDSVGKHSARGAIADFINDNCVDFPDHDFFVHGEFIDTEKKIKYIIKKVINIKSDEIESLEDLRNNPPDVVTHVEVIDLVTKKGNKPSNPLKYLDNLFPARLLDYFFVSGNDVKERLERQDLAADFESILGLDKFNVLTSVMEAIKDEVQTAYVKTQKADKTVADLKLEKDEHLNKLKGDDGLEKELQKVTNEIKQRASIQKEALRELSKYEEGNKIKQEMDDIEKDIQDKENEVKGIAEKLKDRSGHFWAIFAYDHVIEKIQGNQVTYKHKDSQILDAISEIDESNSYIFSSLDSKTQKILRDIHNIHIGKCDVKMTDTSYFDKYKGKSKKIIEEGMNLHRNKQEIVRLHLDKKMKAAELASTVFKDPKAEKDAKQWQEKLEGLDGIINATTGKEKNIRGQIQVAQERIKEIDKILDNKTISLDDNSKKLYEVSSFLIPLIEEVTQNCKEQYREKFQKKCNQVFETVKNPKNPNDYLKIDENYRVSLVRPGLSNKDNEPTPDKLRKKKSGSEGFISATAVTLALSQLAVKDFPIMLDTPFEQGDHDDEDRIIKGWESINQQVIISFQKPEEGKDSPLNYPELKKRFPHSSHYRIHKNEENEASWFEELK